MCVEDVIKLSVLFIFLCVGFTLYLLMTSPYSFELLDQESQYVNDHKFFNGQLPFLLKEPIQTKQLALFKDLTKILNEKNIQFWLTETTLLSFHLFKKLTPWEDKITIAILHSDLHKLVQLRPMLEQTKKQRLIINKNGYSYCENNFALFPNIDIQILQSIDDINIIGCAPLNELGECEYDETLQQWFGKKLSFPKDLIFPLKKIIFDGIELFIPQQFDKYLQSLYGKDLNIQSSKYVCINNKMTMNLFQRVVQFWI